MPDFIAPDPPSASAEFKGIRVIVYASTVTPGAVSVQIESDEAADGQVVRVMFNDADLFIGDPERDDHPWAKQVQAYYDEQDRATISTPPSV